MKLILRKSMLTSLLLSTSFLFSQNLLDTSTWTIGSGATSGFDIIGEDFESVREVGNNHIGEEFVLWKCVPEITVSIQCGGFESDYKTINHNNTYRLSVWVKKTNSNSGTSFFGTRSFSGGTYNIATLSGNSSSSPYFWAGDLPMLNRWYLVVAFVHDSSYSLTVNEGRVYDGVTGEEVQTSIVTDFKFTSAATNIFHRAFLYDDVDVNDRQYMYDPRIEAVNGFEQSIDQLLNLHPDSVLFFSYDVAGNQTQRFYCPESTASTSCIIPTAPSKQSQEDVKDDLVEIDNEENDIINHSKEVSVFPNPTDGKAQIQIKSELLTKIEYIKIYNTNSALIQNVKFTDSQSKLDIDLSEKPTGLYFVHIHFNDGSESVTKKIIKK